MLKEKVKKEFQNMNYVQLNASLINACMKDYLHVVKYLLTSTELKKIADIHVKNDGPLRTACNNHNWKIVQFLLTSPELQEHANIHVENDIIFKRSVVIKDSILIDFLIFEHTIEQTKDIKDFLIEYNEKNIINLFEKRELEQKLQNELEKDHTDYNKIKI